MLHKIKNTLKYSACMAVIMSMGYASEDGSLSRRDSFKELKAKRDRHNINMDDIKQPGDASKRLNPPPLTNTIVTNSIEKAADGLLLWASDTKVELILLRAVISAKEHAQHPAEVEDLAKTNLLIELANETGQWVRESFSYVQKNKDTTSFALLMKEIRETYKFYKELDEKRKNETRLLR